MAKGFQASGLSDWIGDQLKTLDMNSKEATSIIVQIITQLFTEIASNASVAGFTHLLHCFIFFKPKYMRILLWIEAIFLPIVDKMVS